MALVTFIIPVRHQDNARDWGALKANLTQTIASIANQTHHDWRGVVVANEGADLPVLPAGFEAERVDFQPNRLHEQGNATKEEFYESFRLDKGRRVLSGMLRARQSRYFMIVDDDDFVSARIVEHAAESPDSNGWKIDKGFIWNDGGRLLFRHNDFNHICGTSLIIKSDIYALPDRFQAASADWMKSMLGSHFRVAEFLADGGTPLSSLPFPGAIYRVGHGGSHSKRPSFLAQHFLSAKALRRPKQMIRDISRLKLIDRKTEREFFGKPAN
jgi:exopolysaccharide biosynthesis galactosyltransferase PssJ